MQTEKSIKSLLTVVTLVSLILCATIMIGIYTNSRWKRIRDVRRVADAQQIIKAIEFYILDFGQLPENETQDEWDSSFDPGNSNQTLFKSLREKKLLSQVFDPVNNNAFNYRYHKFKAGEYGCSRTFAIFQITSFEGRGDNIGSGFCPDRDFTKEAPNGFTVQWFE
jgi:hypothetical protein